MKTILLTGGTGFLGSHLAHQLCRNYKLIILKRSFSNIWRIRDIGQDLFFYDIDQIELSRVFEENRIDAVIHTATCYGRKQESITDIVDTNFMFPLRLMELSIRYNTDIFVNTDTIAGKYLNYYSLSKKQFLEWLKQCSEKIRIVNMKIEHMYGPKDDDSKFVTSMIHKMLKNEDINLTPGEQKRDFIFIDDVVNAFLGILETLNSSEKKFAEFEIGSGNPVTIRSVVQAIHKLTNSSSQLNFGAVPYRKNEIMMSESDISKIAAMGWKPLVSLQKGMDMTINYELSKIEEYQ